MKVWSTKYCLTNGIEELDADYGASLDYVYYTAGGYTQQLAVEGREWHRSRDAAIARANNVREKKIASLEKSITRLKRIVF